MSRPAGAVVRGYDLYGFALEVSSTDAGVLEAIDLRLRGFGPPPAGAASALRLEVISGPQEPREASGPSRPIYDTRHGCLFYEPATDIVHGTLGGVSLECAPGAGVAVIASSAFDGVARYLAAHPLASISFMEMLERRGRHSLHAGCLAGADGEGVLVAGPSGSGKSTLVLALAQAGLAFVADDTVYLAEAAGEVVALGFSDAIGVTENTARRFEGLWPLLAAAPVQGFPKRLHRPDELLGAPALAACRPATVIFPEITVAGPSRLEAMNAGDALLRLVPDVLLTEPAASQAHLAVLAALLGQARCFTLAFGPDVKAAAALVSSLM